MVEHHPLQENHLMRTFPDVAEPLMHGVFPYEAAP
jgi:hypothetical protein